MKYSKELLEKVASENISVAGVVKGLGLKISGGNSSHIKNRLRYFNIDTSHFLGQSHSKGKTPTTKRTKEEFIEHFLIGNSKIKSHPLKLKLYEFGLKEECCELCGLGNEWNGQKLSLHLDHIDGNSENNKLINLRILCPNCHSQTSTYAGKRNRSSTTKEEKLEKTNKKCTGCNCLITKKATLCRSCKATKQANENRCFTIPDKEALFTMLKESNFTKVAENYGVSCNAIRKWCKKYELPVHSSNYK